MTTRRTRAVGALEEFLGEQVSFAMVIRSTREADDIAQADFAEMLGISRAQLCDIEKGRRVVSAAKAAEFATKLGYSPTYWAQLVWQDEANRAGLDMKICVEAWTHRKKNPMRMHGVKPRKGRVAGPASTSR